MAKTNGKTNGKTKPVLERGRPAANGSRWRGFTAQDLCTLSYAFDYALKNGAMWLVRTEDADVEKLRQELNTACERAEARAEEAWRRSLCGPVR